MIDTIIPPMQSLSKEEFDLEIEIEPKN